MQKLLYRFYEKQIESKLRPADLPRHIGVMVDGNRRWASLQGLEKAGHGHQAGAKKIIDFLGWCSDLKIDHVTLYLLSTDNLKGRHTEELADLIEIIVSLAEELQAKGRWKLQVVGDVASLPEASAKRLAQVEQKTSKNS